MSLPYTLFYGAKITATATVRFGKREERKRQYYRQTGKSLSYYALASELVVLKRKPQTARPSHGAPPSIGSFAVQGAAENRAAASGGGQGEGARQGDFACRRGVAATLEPATRQKKPSPGWSGEGKLGSTMVVQKPSLACG